MEKTNIYIDEVITSMPASSTYMPQLRGQLQEDKVCSEVMSYCQKSWPDCSKLTGPVEAYWPDKALLTVHGYSHGYAQLLALHEGHQGMIRCRERAREAVWWSGLSSQLNELVKNCKPCIKECEKSCGAIDVR